MRPGDLTGPFGLRLVLFVAFWACGDAFATERLHNAVHPSWSPDVSTRHRPGSTEDGVDVYVVDLEGSEPRCLTCIARLGDPPG